MKAIPKPRPYPGHVQARVTEAELVSIRHRAGQEGLSVNAWTRITLLRALHVDPVTRTMMAEFLAMRRIVLTLYTELRQGGKELSSGAIDRLVEDTEYRKYAMADRRIRDTLNLPVERDTLNLPVEEDPASSAATKVQKEKNT